MNKKLINSFVIFFLAIILVSSCAKVSSPAGGPKDKTPPVVVKTTPVNGSKFYTGKKIEITFNEYVVLDKINEKFMVSPPMKNKPEVSIKGKGVLVEYEDELRDSTTYTFNFSDAVKDINEGNIYENLQFVFSTGPVVDSLSVTGNVLNALVLDAPDNALVLLYRDLSASAVKDSLPDYISRTDKNGYFRINNVREGRYRLYALRDNDNSRNFNLTDEEFAFMNEPVEVTPLKNYLPVKIDTVKIAKPLAKKEDTTIMRGENKLIMFQHEKTINYLNSSSRNRPYLMTYTLALPPGDLPFDITVPGSREGSFFTERSIRNDTMTVWMTDTALYSAPLINTIITYPFTDTTGATLSLQDTIPMRFLSPRSARTKVIPPRYQVKSNIPGGNLRPGQKIIFESATPLRSPDTSKIMLYEIKGPEKIRIPYSFAKDSSNSCRVILNAQFDQGKNYQYIADSAAFGDIYGESTDSTGIRITVREEKSFGKLVLNIKGYEGTRVIQLLSKDEKPVRETIMEKDGKAEFPLLDKGTYRIRVIYDFNSDGKWSPGNFNFGIQPEPVSFYPQEIEIKEDWVVDQDWDISAKNVKKLKNIPRQSPDR
ncbi:MAG: Ig-like domain-containing domain [Bacteroidota bacterium]